jgi:hypothetical protein
VHEIASGVTQTAVAVGIVTALGGALRNVLQELGPSVCETEWGKWVGGHAIIEFRYRDEDYVFRVYCFATERRALVVTNGYDKRRDPSPHRQTREIEIAVKRRTAWLEARDRARKAMEKQLADERSRAGQGPVRKR